MAKDGQTTGRRLLRIAEVKEVLGLGTTKVYQMIAKGELAAVKIGRATRVSSEEIDRFLDRVSQPQRDAA